MSNTLLRMFIAGFVGIVALITFSCNQNKQQSTAAPQVTGKSVVDLSGMQLRPGSNKTSFTAVGRARNRTARVVQEITLQFVMEDVLESGLSTTAAEAIIVLKRVIPPHESAEFAKSVVFPAMPRAKGRHEWSFSILAVKNE